MSAHVFAGSASVAAELAAMLPRYDPLLPRSTQKASRRLILLSILLHLVLFVLFHDALLGTVVEKDPIVIVRMLEEEEIKPEPPKRRRKLLAQRRIDTSVARFMAVAQPEIQQIKPVPVLDQTRKVELDPTQLTEAPKRIENRKVVTEKLSVFADVPTLVQPIEVDRINPKVRRVHSGRASAGPRKLEAAGPVTTPHAVRVEAPVVTQGILSRSAVAGTEDGARIAALESGISDRHLDGTGDRGLLSGVEKDCARDPACLAYLAMIRDRVRSRWHIPPNVDPGQVMLRFRVDRGGSAHGIEIRGEDHLGLGSTCLAAFRHASPFPPPPEEIRYIINKNIRANFDYGR